MFKRWVISFLVLVVTFAAPKTSLANEKIFNEVWSRDCSDPNAFGLMWLVDEDGTLRKILHEESAEVYRAEYFELSDEVLTARYHDQLETYSIFDEERPMRIRVMNRTRSGRDIIVNYQVTNGNESNSLYRCEEGEPKSILMNLYTDQREPVNLTAGGARSWAVILTESEIQSLIETGPYFLSSIESIESIEDRSDMDAIFSNDMFFSSSGNTTADLDSKSERRFGYSYSIDISIMAFKTVDAAIRQIQLEHSRIYSGGDFSTIPVLFSSCGDDSLGSQWLDFAPNYFCRVENYFIEVSVANLVSSTADLTLTEAIMQEQVRKILQLM